MFANSVISRSSISIFSLFLSSLLPSLIHFLLTIFSPCLCPVNSFLPLVWFCASSECNLRVSRYALSRHIRPLRDRSLSLSLSLSFDLSLFLCRPSVLPFLPPPLPPRLSFIYRAARVSLFLIHSSSSTCPENSHYTSSI